jgi:hypothetical protein
MLLCDQVITEAGSNKKSLIGTFDGVLWPGQPVVLPVAIYAKITDAEGSYRFHIDYVYVPTDKRLARVTLDHPVEIPDRLRFSELALHLPAPVPEPGLYEFRLFANDAYVGRAVFSAYPAAPTGE